MSRTSVRTALVASALLYSGLASAESPHAARAYPVEVCAEVRVIAVTAGSEEASMIERHRGDGGVVFLDAVQAARITSGMRNAKNVTMMSTGEITTFSGRRASIEFIDHQTFITGVDKKIVGGVKDFRPRTETLWSGTKAKIKPTVVGEGRQVRLELAVEQAEIDSQVPTFPIACGLLYDHGPSRDEGGVLVTQYVQQPRRRTLVVEKTVVVPAGKVALLFGPTVRREVRTSSALPVLGRLPLVGPSFTTIGYAEEERQVFLLVIARIAGADRLNAPSEEECEEHAER